MRVRLGAAIAAAFLAFAGAAHATVVTFDDLVGSDLSVPDGYAGITWNGQWVYFGADQTPYTPASPPNRVYDLSASGAFDFAAPVIFDGADFAGLSGVTLKFQLYLAGALVATSGVLTTSDVPTFLSSGYSGLVDEVRVMGADVGAFVMDNVTYDAAPAGVPEPVSWAMMLVGFFGLGAGLRARRRTAAA